MAKTNIIGRYHLRAVINASYQFTGNNRAASFVYPNLSDELILSCVNAPQGQTALLTGQASATIKRARLISAGAPGLSTPNDGTPAASIWLSLTSNYGTGQEIFKLRFSNWNEWEETDIELEPYKYISSWTSSAAAGNYAVKVNIEQQPDTEFNLDDFNIQADYVGETFTPVLELEIMTAGMCLAGYNDILF